MPNDRPFDPPPPGADGQTPPSVHEWTPEGRLRCTTLSSTERSVAAASHLWWLLLMTPVSFLAPGVPIFVWLYYRGKNPFLADHGQEATNFILSLLILHVVLMLTFVGIAFLPVLWIYALVGIVRASASAANGEYFRYPITIRLL